MIRQRKIRTLSRDNQFYRPTALVLLAEAAAHLPVIGPHLAEAPYVGYSFIAFCLAAAVVAVALVVRGRRALLVAGAGLCGAAPSAPAATPLVAFPLIGDDV